jgi:hypothetical protein
MPSAGTVTAAVPSTPSVASSRVAVFAAVTVLEAMAPEVTASDVFHPKHSILLCV